MWEILDGSMLVIHQRIHTGERSYKCSSVGNYLIAAAHSLDIGQKGLMSTSKVGNFRGTTTDSLHTSQFMLLWHENSKYGNDFAYNSGLIKHCWVCAWEMSSESSECWSIFGQNSCPFGSKKFTPKKELMGAANEERLQPKAALIGTVKYCYVLMGFFLFIVLKYTCKKFATLSILVCSPVLCNEYPELSSSCVDEIVPIIQQCWFLSSSSPSSLNASLFEFGHPCCLTSEESYRFCLFISNLLHLL